MIKYILKNEIYSLIIRNGSLKHLGKVAYIDKDLDYFGGGNFVSTLRVKNIEKYNSKYLFYILQSDVFKKYIIEGCKQVTVNGIDKKLLKGFNFQLPSIDIQNKIVNILDTFNEYINGLTNNKTGLSNLINLNNKLLKFYLETLIK